MIAVEEPSVGQGMKFRHNREQNGAPAPHGWSERLRPINLAISLIALAVGLAAQMAGAPSISHIVWIVGIVPVLATLLTEIASSLRRGEVGLEGRARLRGKVARIERLAEEAIEASTLCTQHFIFAG